LHGYASKFRSNHDWVIGFWWAISNVHCWQTTDYPVWWPLFQEIWSQITIFDMNVYHYFDYWGNANEGLWRDFNWQTFWESANCNSTIGGRIGFPDSWLHSYGVTLSERKLR
jgi:hypothetical protein